MGGAVHWCLQWLREGNSYTRCRSLPNPSNCVGQLKCWNWSTESTHSINPHSISSSWWWAECQFAVCRNGRSTSQCLSVCWRVGQIEQTTWSVNTKDIINRDICPCETRILNQFDVPARFTTTMSIFMYLFLEFSVQIREHADYCISITGTVVHLRNNFD